MSSHAHPRALLQYTAVLLMSAASGCGTSTGADPSSDSGLADSAPASGALPTGFYDVTSNQADDGCTGTPVTATSAAMFEIYTDPTIGPAFAFIHSCSDPTHCPDSNDPFVASFVAPDAGGGWSGQAFAASMGASCRLLRFGGHVTATGTALRLELERDELDVPGASTCDGATAQARASELACTQRRVVTGVPH